MIELRNRQRGEYQPVATSDDELEPTPPPRILALQQTKVAAPVVARKASSGALLLPLLPGAAFVVAGG